MREVYVWVDTGGHLECGGHFGAGGGTAIVILFPGTRFAK